MNEPEEYRKIEKDARELSTKISELMILKPRSRWILGPIRRAVKWVEYQCDEALKEDGWR